MSNRVTAYHIGDRVLVIGPLGDYAWEGVVVETAGVGTRVKVQPVKKKSFWRKKGTAYWITAWSRVVPIDARAEEGPT